jgi:hypothetical protein
MFRPESWNHGPSAFTHSSFILTEPETRRYRLRPNGFSPRWQLSRRLPGWRSGGWIGSRRSPPWNTGIDLPCIRALRRAFEAVRAYTGKLPSQCAFPKTRPPAHPRGGAGVLFGAI